MFIEVHVTTEKVARVFCYRIKWIIGKKKHAQKAAYLVEWIS